MKRKITLLASLISLTFYSQTWNLSGNSGTNPNANFIGTIDNQSLVFRVNNTEKLRISSNGRLIFFNNNSQTYSNNLYIGGGNETTSNSSTNWGNVAVGLGTMNANVNGNANTAIGFNSLASNTSGSSNTAAGINSMKNSVSTSFNTAYGHNTLMEIGTGQENTSIGLSAMAGLPNYTASNNTALGSNVLRGISNGSYNTVVGSNSFRIFRTGSNNIVLGYNNLSAYELYNVSNNIFIGNNITPINSQPNNELNIGNWIYGLDGKISIGGRATFTCADCTDYSLFVKNGIKAEKVKVDVASANGWADYVFNENYNLKSLEEVEKHINENGHLPNIPSAKEVVENGINVAEMDAKLLEKIEELTLYSIEHNKQNKIQEEKIKQLQEEISELKKQSEKIEKLEKMLLELTSKK